MSFHLYFMCVISTLQRPFKNLPPTGKAIPPPKISDSLYQSKASIQAAAAKVPASQPNQISHPIPTNGLSTFSSPQPKTEKLQPPSSPPLPPPPEQAQTLTSSTPSDYAMTEL